MDDSLRSLHARVAALARHRGIEDPEAAAAREQLAECRDMTYAQRALLCLTPEGRERILAGLQGDSAHV